MSKPGGIKDSVAATVGAAFSGKGCSAACELKARVSGARKGCIVFDVRLVASLARLAGVFLSGAAVSPTAICMVNFSKPPSFKGLSAL